jgi:hypothetical protein
MISQFADQAKVQEIFSRSPELERFAFEFCKAFNCTIQECPEPEFGRRNPTVALLTKDGVPCGTLKVDPSGDKDKQSGKYVPVYYYESPIVSKSKGSARAGRNCRDSISIKGLIDATKRANDIPTIDKLLEHHINGISYAFSVTQRDTGSSRMQMSKDAILALIRSHLELDKSSVNLYDAEIKEIYKQYLDSEKKSMEANKLYERFCAGSYLIGVHRPERHMPPFYTVAEVSNNGMRHTKDVKDFTFHTPLKRYASLMDCPEIAPHVPIIAAWASGMLHSDADNELKLPRADKYYPEIDVASGYADVEVAWHLIPKAHE